MVLQIHDEIAFEIREGMEDHYLPRIQAVMERAGEDFCRFTGVSVKFATSAGKWGEK
jgi:DNA polymerase I-like protein with 3'-5' exonuclease and polymerase domains